MLQKIDVHILLSSSICQMLTKRQTEIIRLLRSAFWGLVLRDGKIYSYKRDTDLLGPSSLLIPIEEILIMEGKGKGDQPTLLPH